MRLRMTWQDAVKEGYRLYEKHVSGDNKVDLKRVQSSLRQEIEWTRQRPARVSPGLLTEFRHELAIVGSILKNHPDLFNRESL